ncbi:MAG TPA: polyprenyl synthetase family protein [Actinomycetota bacterium]|nr:polyprenyl synthetase family protein [Actinomycetota bacterium]
MTGLVAGPSEQWLVEDLLRVEDVLATTAGGSSHPLTAEASTHLIKAGGKRLRPALVLTTSRAGRAGERATDLAAAALELVHLATLYHDDVIDETETRRGVPTVHAKWGLQVAVLAGDYLFACGCGLGAEAGGEVPGILSNAIANVCEGQIVESEALENAQRAPSEYIATIKLKTASLFAAACELGSSTSGVEGATRAALADYGLNLGIAFQLVDDLLDLVGDPELTGKELGTDLREGVFTLPVLLAAQRDERLAHDLDAGLRDLEVVLKSLHATGAVSDTLAEARGYGKAASSALSGLPESEWRSVLDKTVEGVLAQVP